MTIQEDPVCLLRRVLSKLPQGTWFALHQHNSQFTSVPSFFGLSTEEWDSLLLASGIYKMRGTQKRLFMDTFHHIMTATDVHDTRKKIDGKDMTLICHGYPNYGFVKTQVQSDQSNYRPRRLPFDDISTIRMLCSNQQETTNRETTNENITNDRRLAAETLLMIRDLSEEGDLCHDGDSQDELGSLVSARQNEQDRLIVVDDHGNADRLQDDDEGYNVEYDWNSSDDDDNRHENEIQDEVTIEELFIREAVQLQVNGDGPRRKRNSDELIPLHNKKQFTQEDRMIARCIAMQQMGWRKQLTWRGKKRIARAVCNLVSYDRGYRMQLRLGNTPSLLKEDIKEQNSTLTV